MTDNDSSDLDPLDQFIARARNGERVEILIEYSNISPDEAAQLIKGFRVLIPPGMQLSLVKRARRRTTAKQDDGSDAEPELVEISVYKTEPVSKPPGWFVRLRRRIRRFWYRLRRSSDPAR